MIGSRTDATGGEASSDGVAPATGVSPEEREAARIAAIEAEIAERERRKAAGSPFKTADPVAAMAERLAELQNAGRSVRPVGATPLPSVDGASVARARAVASTAPTTTADPKAWAAQVRPAMPPPIAGATTGAADVSPATPTPAPGSTEAVVGYELGADRNQTGGPGAAAGGGVAAGAGTVDEAAMVDGAIVPSRAVGPFRYAPHLVFFLHDEVIVHAPAGLADEVADAIRASAAAATRLLFGQFPIDVPLDIAIVDSYADAD